MHRGDSLSREARRLARDHAISPRYENPGAVRAGAKRRCARTARRVLRRVEADVSMASIEAEIFAAIEAEAHAYDEAVALAKEAEEAVAWEDHAWGNYNPYDDYDYDYDDRGYDPGEDWRSEDEMWREYLSDAQRGCEWFYSDLVDYDEELRLASEDARSRALGAALYLQGEDPEGDAEAATSREVDRERRVRRFHQKYHRD